MDAIAIADANKIRAAMGLPPLPVPGESAALTFKQDGKKGTEMAEEEDHISTLERRTAAAGSNWAKLEAEKQAVIERQKRKEALKKQRDAAQRFAVLEGKGLGDADGEEMDTRSWLMGQKKRQKKIQRTRQEELDQAARKQAAQKAYGASDLKGLKVGHELDDFGDGDQILTLRDAEIGDGEESGEDELENAEILEKEKLAENLKRKKKGPLYDPNEVNEDGGQTILGQYDEEITGRKRKRFTLDAKGGGSAQAVTASGAALGGRGIKISLDALLDDAPVSDYADPSTAKVRKPKKPKKERKVRQREVDEADLSAAPQQPTDEAMDIDAADTSITAKQAQIELDDEDLQSQLATQRRQALKKRKKLDAAEVARQIKAQEEQPAAEERDDEEEPGLVIDETREFVAHLERPNDEEDAPKRQRSVSASPPPPDVTEDMPDQDVDMSAAEDEAATPVAESANDTNTAVLDQEETTSSLGSVAAMLRKRGLISADAAANASATAAYDRKYAEFLAANRSLIAEFDAKARQAREADRASGRFQRMSNAQQQEYGRQENERREAYLAQLQARHFRDNYKPEVNIKYHDEFGRQLGQKEAFKQMSHQFHGKGSGKGKMEKRLKKIEDEKRRAGKAWLEDGAGEGKGGMEDVRAEQGRRRGQAGVRLQ